MKHTVIKVMVFCAVIVLMLFACSDHPYKSDLKELEKLNLVLDSARNTFNSIELEELVVTKAKIESDRNLLINYVNDHPESFSTEIGTLIDDLRIALKNLRKIESNQVQLKDQINYSTEQLNNLKNDLENNILEEKDVKKYIKDEKTAIKSLKKAVDQVKHYSYLGVLKYENNKAAIDSLKQLAKN